MLLLLACVAAESPIVGVATTREGSWSLALEETTYDVGVARVVVIVTPLVTEGSAEGLTLYARPGMDDMEHALGVVPFEEESPGAYAADLTFDMSGLWTLSGYVGGGAEGMEGFDFVVEVLP